MIADIKDEDAWSGLRKGGSERDRMSRSHTRHSPLVPLIALEESWRKEKNIIHKALVANVASEKEKKELQKVLLKGFKKSSEITLFLLRRLEISYTSPSSSLSWI